MGDASVPYERRIGVRYLTPPVPAVIRYSAPRVVKRRSVTVTRDVPATVHQVSATGVLLTLDGADDEPRLGSTVLLRLSDSAEATGVLRRHADSPPDAYGIEIVSASSEFQAVIGAHLDDGRGDLALAWRLAP